MKFGDIIVNHVASDQNPNKKGVFVQRGTRTGKVNSGDYIVRTNMKGKFWETSDGDHLEVVGNIMDENSDLAELAKTTSDLVGGVDEIEGWWCPSCGGETICTFAGTCEECGYPIEDNQPDMEKIKAVKSALAKFQTDED